MITKLDTRYYKQALLRHIRSCLTQHCVQDLDASGLVSLTNALSMADHESEKSAVLLKAIAAGALDLIPSFAPGQAVSLLSSFSCLRHYDEPLYRAVSRHLLAQGLQQLQPRQQANLLLSLARMVRGSSFRSAALAPQSSSILSNFLQ